MGRPEGYVAVINPAKKFKVGPDFEEILLPHQLRKWYLCYHKSIFRRGSLAFSSVSLYLKESTRSSNSFLFSGWKNESPMRHWPAEELNFFAVLRKMMLSLEGSMTASTTMRIFTWLWQTYGMRKKPRHSMLPYSDRFGCGPLLLEAC